MLRRQLSPLHNFGRAVMRVSELKFPRANPVRVLVNVQMAGPRGARNNPGES
jgi:hypothetical protein